MKRLDSRLGIAATLLLTGTVPATEDPLADRHGSTSTLSGSFEAHSVEDEGEVGSSVRSQENRIVFSSDMGGAQSMNQMQERLKDPEQRALLRAEQRAMIAGQYSDLAEELSIDPQTEHKLIELLTDEQIAQLESFAGPDYDTAVQAQAEAETKRLTTLRQILGDEGAEKFQRYLSTTFERAQVKRLDSLMDPADRFQPEQKQRLIELFAEQSRRERDTSLPRGWQITPRTTLPSREELQRESQLATIAANEDALRRMESTDPMLQKQAAEFLSPSQLAVLTRENEHKAASLRRWIEDARQQAGLDPTIPEEPDPTLLPQAPKRTPLAGSATFELDISVDDGNPRKFTHTGENGRPFQLQVAEDLWIEATPTLFEDHWLDVRLNYLERTEAGKRRLESETNFGTLVRLPDGSTGGRGMAVDVVSGRKGYAVRAIVSARPAEKGQ